MTIKLAASELELNRTLIMGVVNVTPDSFSGDGLMDPSQAVDHAEELLIEGADILDIGGESSRPGSDPVSVEEEIRRIGPIIKYLSTHTRTILSVDTYKPEVARFALENGAHIINDIYGGRDPELLNAVAEYKAGYVLMHMQGRPKEMQNDPRYDDVITDIADFFTKQLEAAIAQGVNENSIILDPGIGFGKTLEHNLQILNRLPELKERFSHPLLLGVSRKRFIGTLTGKETAEERTYGTAAAIALSVWNGASIVRVHDIREMRDVVKVAEAIRKSTA